MYTSIGTSAGRPAARTFRREPHAAEDLHGARVAALHLRQELRRGLALDQRAAHAALAEVDGEHQPHRSRADDQDFGIDRLIIISRMRAIIAALAAGLHGSPARRTSRRAPSTSSFPTRRAPAPTSSRARSARKLAERWKVAVVTENKPGATGNIGADFVAKAPPDGTTLLVAATSFAHQPGAQSRALTIR